MGMPQEWQSNPVGGGSSGGSWFKGKLRVLILVQMTSTRPPSITCGWIVPNRQRYLMREAAEQQWAQDLPIPVLKTTNRSTRSYPVDVSALNWRLGVLPASLEVRKTSTNLSHGKAFWSLNTVPTQSSYSLQSFLQRGVNRSRKGTTIKLSGLLISKELNILNKR